MLAPTRPNTGLALTLSVSAVVVPQDGIRRAATTPEQDAGLAASVRALGVLLPIIVRAHPTDRALWLVVDGRRRLRAAMEAGLATIQAVDRADLTDADATAIETAANIQRAALAPVDQWRAIRRLQDLGWQMDGAADAMGIPHRLAQRLDKLGRLHPDVLAAIEAHGMPSPDGMATIANATPDVQAAAIRREPQGHEPAWWRVTQGCAQTRIPISRAIFDTALAGVVFEEDLFAEPDDPDRFETTDIAGFVEAQQAALVKRVADSKGRLALGASMKNSSVAIPKGFEHAYGWAFGDDKMPRGLTGFVMVDPLTGRIHSTAARKPAPVTPPPKKDKPSTEAAPTRESTDADSDDDDDQEESAAAAPPPEPTPKPRLTQAGRELLAELRTDGLRAALRDRPILPVGSLVLLLLALSARNVKVSGERGNSYRTTDFEDVAAATFAALAEPDFNSQLDQLEIIGKEAVARILICSGTKAGNGSGAAAEWIGEMIQADSALPRLDREDLLATLSGDALRELAQAAGHKPGKVSAMRGQLAGSTPDLRLAEARFHAPRPEIEPEPDCARAGGADRCPCGWKASDGTEGTDCARGEWQARMRRLGLAEAPPAEAPAAPPAQAAPAAPADHACRWNGKTECPESVTAFCQRECPRRDEYDAWWESPAATRAITALPPDPPATKCGWNGESLCSEEGTTVCHRLCDRHAKYAAWVSTPKGKAARRNAENAEARARRIEGRGRGA